MMTRSESAVCATPRRLGISLLLAAVATFPFACVQWSDVQEQRTALVPANQPCPALSTPGLPARWERILDEGDPGQVVSIDAGPVEGARLDREEPDGTVVALQECVYLVTVRYRTGG